MNKQQYFQFSCTVRFFKLNNLKVPTPNPIFCVQDLKSYASACTVCMDQNISSMVYELFTCTTLLHIWFICHLFLTINYHIITRTISLNLAFYCGTQCLPELSNASYRGWLLRFRGPFRVSHIFTSGTANLR